MFGEAAGGGVGDAGVQGCPARRLARRTADNGRARSCCGTARASLPCSGCGGQVDGVLVKSANPARSPRLCAGPAAVAQRSRGRGQAELVGRGQGLVDGCRSPRRTRPCNPLVAGQVGERVRPVPGWAAAATSRATCSSDIEGHMAGVAKRDREHPTEGAHRDGGGGQVRQPPGSSVMASSSASAASVYRAAVARCLTEPATRAGGAFGVPGRGQSVGPVRRRPTRRRCPDRGRAHRRG